jgi:hypothetical protein
MSIHDDDIYIYTQPEYLILAPMQEKREKKIEITKKGSLPLIAKTTL